MEIEEKEQELRPVDVNILLNNKTLNNLIKIEFERRRFVKEQRLENFYNLSPEMKGFKHVFLLIIFLTIGGLIGKFML